MKVFHKELRIQSRRQGGIEITREVETALQESGARNGVATVFCRHTSCSLVIMENADPSAWRDLEGYFNRLAPDDDPHFTHTHEGPDDMPSHIKMALTRTSESIPLTGGRLALGTWQGIFLWEHRTSPHVRTVIVTVVGE